MTSLTKSLTLERSVSDSIGKEDVSPIFYFFVGTLLLVWLKRPELLGSALGGQLGFLFAIGFFLLTARIRDIRDGFNSLSKTYAVLFSLFVLVSLLSCIWLWGDSAAQRTQIETIIFVGWMLQTRYWSGLQVAIIRVAEIFVILNFLTLFDGLFGFAIIKDNIWFRERFIGYLPHSNMTAALSAFLIAFILNKTMNMRSLVTLVSLVAIILLCRSRTAMAIAGLSIAIKILQPWVRPWRLTRASFLTIVGLFFMFSIFAEDIGEFVTRGQQASDLTSLTGRTDLWKFALRDIEHNIFTGVGSKSGFTKLWSSWRHRYILYPGGAHNFFLAQTQAYGIFYGVILFVLFVFTVAKSCGRLRSRRTRSTEELRMDVIAFSVMLGAILFSFTEAGLFYMYYPTGPVVIWAMIHISKSQNYRADSR